MLRDSGRTGTASRQARYVRRGLAMAQVALAFVLLVGAGLLLASFRQLLGVNPGFQSHGILTGPRVAARQPSIPTMRPCARTRRACSTRFARLPGVEGAGISTNIPFGWDDSSSVIIPEGHVKAPGESVVSPRQVNVTPGIFEALRVSLKRGRFFTASDDEKAPRVIILDEQAGEDVLAERRSDRPARVPAQDARRRRQAGPDVTWMQVVGVVGADEDEGARRRRGGVALGRLLLPAGAGRAAQSGAS